MAYVATMYLLAQFREKRAFPLIIEFCRLPEIEEFLNDIITEDLARILVSVFDGDVQSIQDLLEDEDTNEWVRAEMLRTLELLYALDKVDRDQLVAYHRRLYDKLRPEDTSFGESWFIPLRLHFAELQVKSIGPSLKTSSIYPLSGRMMSIKCSQMRLLKPSKVMY
ncbi:MAG: DUF1186 domain-containing protein [Caldilineaceae bacterium]